MKLTEEEFKELYEICLIWDNNFKPESYRSYSSALQKAKLNGWIERSAVEEFIECYYQFKAYYDDYQGNYPAAKLAKKAMKAIEELQEKYENKKFGEKNVTKENTM